jgi:hypothetical protein
VTVPFDRTSLQITASPSTSLEIQNLLGKWRALPRTPQQIVFSAGATAVCGPGDSASGYEVGIVQFQITDINNARYLGATPSDGSLWIRRDIPAVRPPGPCHDSPWRTVGRRAGPQFWNTSTRVSCNTPVSLEHRDFPQDMYDTIVENPVTRRPNYLSELHLRFEFTTALMLRRPDDSIETLRWARWEVGWDYTFDTPASGESRIRRGIATTSSLEWAVRTPAPPELPTRYALPAKNCNTITYEASNNPARIDASASQ